MARDPEFAPSTSEQYDNLQTLIQWAAPPPALEKAKATAALYQTDPVALHLLTAFYSYLPGDQEAAVTLIRQGWRRQGFFLLAAVTEADAVHLYLASTLDAIYLGTPEEGIWDEEVLTFLELADNEASRGFLAHCRQWPPYRPASLDPTLCPVCFTGKDEEHILGCPVEVCPWCGGQLTRCNCRFQVLGRDRLERDAHLEAFHQALQEKGRIPFDPAGQSPVHPAAASRLAGDKGGNDPTAESS